MAKSLYALVKTNPWILVGFKKREDSREQKLGGIHQKYCLPILSPSKQHRSHLAEEKTLDARMTSAWNSS